MNTFVIPIAHPSWILRGNWAHSTLQPRYLATAKQILDGTYEPIDVNSLPSNANIDPTLEQLHAFSNNTSNPYTVDIECAGDHLVMVGILSIPNEDYICVRFRGLHGSIYDPDTICPKTHWLFDFLANQAIEKIFHNGQAFDVPYLENQGFTVAGFVDDTMLQAHLTYAELPKKLAFLAQVYCNIPNWKTLVKPEDEEKEQ